MAPKSKFQISKVSTPGRSEKEKEKEKEFANLPNWPPLAPLVPIFDLSLDTLLDDQILVIRNLFTSTLCKSYIAYLSTLPLVTTPGKPKKGEAVRVNDRFQVDDASFSNLLWEKTALQELISQDGTDKWGGQVLGLNSNIRIYRYRPERAELGLIRVGDQRVAAAGLSLGQDLAGNACVAFSMIADLERAARSFGDRAYRYVHFEAGGIGQRLYLSATSLGLRATGIGAFFDDKVHGYLNLSPAQGQVIYHFAIGYPVLDPRL